MNDRVPVRAAPLRPVLRESRSRQQQVGGPDAQEEANGSDQVSHRTPHLSPTVAAQVSYSLRQSSGLTNFFQTRRALKPYSFFSSTFRIRLISQSFAGVLLNAERPERGGILD